MPQHQPTITASNTSAYVLVTFQPKDPEKLQQYSAAVTSTLSQHAGEIVLKGSATLLHDSLQSTPQPHDELITHVILLFPTQQHAVTWYHCAEYQAITALRDAGMDSKFLLLG